MRIFGLAAVVGVGIVLAACAAPVEGTGAGESVASESSALTAKPSAKTPLHTTSDPSDDPGDPPPPPPPPTHSNYVCPGLGYIYGGVVVASGLEYDQPYCPPVTLDSGEIVEGQLGDAFWASVPKMEVGAYSGGNMSDVEKAMMTTAPAYCVYDDGRAYDKLVALDGVANITTPTVGVAPLCFGNGGIGGGVVGCMGCKI